MELQEFLKKKINEEPKVVPIGKFTRAKIVESDTGAGWSLVPDNRVVNPDGSKYDPDTGITEYPDGRLEHDLVHRPARTAKDGMDNSPFLVMCKEDRNDFSLILRGMGFTPYYRTGDDGYNHEYGWEKTLFMQSGNHLRKILTVRLRHGQNPSSLWQASVSFAYLSKLFRNNTEAALKVPEDFVLSEWVKNPLDALKEIAQKVDKVLGEVVNYME